MAKKLLEEGTVRRFMKIAGLQPLSESFVDALEEEVVEEEVVEESEDLEEAKEEDKEKMEEAYHEKEPGMEPMKEEAEEEMDAPADEMAPEPEAVEDEEVEMDMGDEGMMDEDEKVDLLQKLAQALGVDVEVDAEDEMEGGDEEPAAEAPADDMMDAEEELEEGMHMDGEEKAKPDGDKADPGPKGVKEEDEMKEGPHMQKESREDFKNRLVEQVAKRVAERLKELK